MASLDQVAEKMLEVLAKSTPNETYAARLYNLAMIIYTNMAPEEKEKVK